jgi:hypothetical protein
MPGWFNISLFVRSHSLVIVQDYMHILCIYAWILIYVDSHQQDPVVIAYILDIKMHCTINFPLQLLYIFFTFI